MRYVVVSIFAALILGAAGCGGRGGGPAALPSPGPVTFHQSGGFSANPPDITYTILASGSATKTQNGGPAGSAQLTATQTAQLYADVEKAMPLNSLPLSSVPDSPSITVSFQGQASPDIFGASDAREQALLSDMSVIQAALP